jgi:hypothetical protein
MQQTNPTYTCAPWHLRMRWLFLGWVWGWGKTCETMGAVSPELANMWWRK